MKKITQNKLYLYLSILVLIVAILAIILGTIYGVKKKNNRVSENIEITFHSKTGKEIAKRKFKLNEKINISFSDAELELAKNEEFIGWTNTLSGNVISDLKASLNNRNLYPVYRLKSAQTTKYEIKRHFEKVDESGFDTESETVLGAEPGKEVQLSQDKIVAPKGFELDSATSETKKTVVAEGTTVFNLYFIRKTYKVTFDFDGGMLDGETKKEVSYKFGQNLQDIEKPTKTDPSGLKKYSFRGWLNQATNELIDFTKNNPVEADIDLVAKWETSPQTTKYEIKRHFEKVNGGDFDVETETVDGIEAGSEVQLTSDKTAAPRGFELNPANSETKKTISPDGTTIFNLYFIRKTYKVTFDFDGGMLDGETKKEVSYKFGQNLQDIKKPTKTDPSGLKKYSFQGWLNQATNELVDFTQNNPVETNLHLVAKWQEIDNTKKSLSKLNLWRFN